MDCVILGGYFNQTFSWRPKKFPFSERKYLLGNAQPFIKKFVKSDKTKKRERNKCEEIEEKIVKSDQIYSIKERNNIFKYEVRHSQAIYFLLVIIPTTFFIVNYFVDISWMTY